MPQTRMFRDRMVSMEQTMEGGEKHLELLKALCREALPGFDYREHSLDHERDLFVMVLEAPGGQIKRVSWTRMVLFDAESESRSCPAIRSAPYAERSSTTCAAARDAPRSWSHSAISRRAGRTRPSRGARSGGGAGEGIAAGARAGARRVLRRPRGGRWASPPSRLRNSANAGPRCRRPPLPARRRPRARDPRGDAGAAASAGGGEAAGRAGRDLARPPPRLRGRRDELRSDRGSDQDPGSCPGVR
jgi:hypothetical protein